MRRRRNADRTGRGLRHFSMKVCKKVEEKGTTTYNEVADELVEEVSREARVSSTLARCQGIQTTSTWR